MENIAIADFLQFLEALYRLVFVGLVISGKSADKFAVIEVRHLVIYAHLESAVFISGHKTQAVGEIEVAFIKLDPMASLVVKTFQFLGNLELRIFLLFLGSNVIIADAQIPLIDDSLERLIDQRSSFWGSFPLSRRSSNPQVRLTKIQNRDVPKVVV